MPVRSAIGSGRSLRGWTAALLLGACVLGALMGAVAGLGSLLLLVPFAALLAGAFIAFGPVRGWIWLLVVLSLLFVGPALYFGHVDSARWVVPMVGIGLALPALLVAFQPDDERLPVRSRTSWPHLLLIAFLAWAALSTAINRAAVGDWLGYVRYYLVIVPLVYLLARGAFDRVHWRWIWRFYVFSALAQAPVAILQNRVFAARQVRSAEWDAVVGTFPGQAEGGGASAAMGTYLVIAIVFALCLWRARALRGIWVLAVLGAALTTLAFAEVKAVVLLIAIAVLMVFADQFRREPARAVVSVLVAGLLSAGLLSLYNRVHYGNQVTMGQLTAPRSAMEAIRNQLDPDRESFYTGEMGRVASFVDWWRVNATLPTWPDALIGHGASSTQVSRINVGELAPQSRHPLNQTSTGVLLWETGIVGHLLLAAGMLAAAGMAWRLQRSHVDDPEHQALLRAAAVSLVLLAMTLPYKSFLFSTAPSQVLFAMLLGYVAWARRTWGLVPSARESRLSALRRESVALT